MSGGFGLPVLNLAESLGKLGTAFNTAYDQERSRTALAALGTQLKGGDYAGAASTAFDAGDVTTGLGLLKLGREARKDTLGEAASRDLIDVMGFGGGQTAPGGVGPRSDASRSLPAFADVSGDAGSYVANLFKRESNNNPNAQAATSSARGLGQFTRGTWNNTAKQHPELSLTPVGSGQDGRTDPDQMLRATQAHTADNEAVLRRAGLPVNDATRYSAHFLGSGGAVRFVGGAMRNPDAPAVSFVGADQARANRTIFFNRDGSPKTAGEVMGDFARSFGGGGAVAQASRRAPAAGRVAVANTEAEAQALERRMGMLPQDQAQAYDPRADLPAEGMVPAGFYIPGTDPVSTGEAMRGAGQDSPALPVPGGVGGNARNAGRDAAVPTLGGSSQGRPAMRMPGADGSPGFDVAQLGGRAGQTATDATGGAIGGVPAATIAQSPLGQRIPGLMRVLANPHLPEGQRQLASTMLKEGLEQARMPEGVKEFVWARANGLTQARSPQEYAREAKGPTTLAPGTSVLSPDGQSIVLTAPDRSRSNVSDDAEQRRAVAADIGLAPGSPQYQSYVATGKMPREDQQPLTASDKKAILEADDGVVSAETAIGNLTAAKNLSAKAYVGPFANRRGQFTAMFGNETGQATLELDNLVTTNALGQLKAIFGAAPTEGERKILLDIQGSSDMPHALRVKIYDRAIALAERRLDLNRERAAELRGQTYYRPGSGPGARSAAPGEERRALPAPSPSNRSGGSSAPPAAAIDLLRSQPELQDQFDQKYGPGAAARALGGR